MELCILIPAKNEALTITETIENLVEKLEGKIHYNILVVNDNSDDNTLKVLEELVKRFKVLRYINNKKNSGVGNAIRFGLSVWEGDIIALCMADGSDSVNDIIISYDLIYKLNYDCVFGSRFIKKGVVYNYPILKLFFNRVFNNYVKFRSRIKYNDFTNIFKVYSRHAIESISPIESEGYSIGLEMSLKAFKKQLSIDIIPISWTQRKAGNSKLKLLKNINNYMGTLRKTL